MDPQIPRWDLWAIQGLFWATLGLFQAYFRPFGPFRVGSGPILGSLGLSQEGKCGSTNSTVGSLSLSGLDLGIFEPILSLNRPIRRICDWIWAILRALSLHLGHLGESWTYFRPILGLFRPISGFLGPISGANFLQFWAILGQFG